VSGSGCQANAADTDGSVKRVDFFLSKGGTSTPVGSKTAAPYQCAINTANFANGSYTLMAVATDNQNAVTSVQRSLTISKPSGGGGTTPVNPAHILTRATADAPFSQQDGYTAQVINTYTAANNIAEAGIHGSRLPNGETMRFGKTVDPTNSTLKALSFQVKNTDPTTSDGKRAELSIQPNIEMNKVYWITFSAYVYDWGTLGANDSALFGTQVHTGDNQAGVGGPSFGIYTTQNGRMLRVHSRYSESANPHASNVVKLTYAEHPIPFHRWTDFVVKFKHNTNGSGLLQVWMDGELIANYRGSLGYNTGKTDYAKFGYYNWSGSAMGANPRKVLLRSPTIVADPTGSTYSAEQVRALLDAAH
jgi:polysaccharide lyase-like protein/Big-like domain-containing protein